MCCILQCVGKGVGTCTRHEEHVPPALHKGLHYTSEHWSLPLHQYRRFDKRCKRSLLQTTLNRAYHLSSSLLYLSEECERPRTSFSQRKYPAHLIDSTITRFVAHKSVSISENFDTHVKEAQVAVSVKLCISSSNKFGDELDFPSVSGFNEPTPLDNFLNTEDYPSKTCDASRKHTTTAAKHLKGLGHQSCLYRWKPKIIVQFCLKLLC